MSTAIPAPDDNIRSFLPIFYLSKVFGCNLYSLPRTIDGANLNAYPTAFDVLCCLIHFALYIFVCIPLSQKWDSYDKVFSNEFASNMGSSGLVIIVFLGNIMGYATCIKNLFIIVMDMINSAKMRRIMLSFNEFDTQMTKTGVKIESSHKRISLFFVLTTVFWQFLTIWLGMTIAEGTRDSRISFVVATYLGHAIMFGCQASYLTTFFFILASLADRLHAINDCLNKHLTEARQNNGTSDCTFVHNLSTSYLKLVQIVETVSQANAPQFVLCTASLFVSATVTAFMTYQVLHHSIQYGTPATAVYFSMGVIHYSFLMYKTISIGSKIRKEKITTQSLINKSIATTQISRGVSSVVKYICA